MADPATVQVVYALLAGTGVAFVVVLLMLGLYRLVRRRPQPRPVEEFDGGVVDAPAEEPEGSEEPEEPAAEVPAPRDPAEAPVPAEEPGEVAAKPLSRKIPA